MPNSSSKQTDIAVSVKTIVKNLTLSPKKILVEILKAISDVDSKNVFVFNQSSNGQNRLLVVKILKSGQECNLPDNATYGLVNSHSGSTLPFLNEYKIVDLSDMQGFMSKI